jgi:uncharacterized LabA/DUF88 family protein
MPHKVHICKWSEKRCGCPEPTTVWSGTVLAGGDNIGSSSISSGSPPPRAFQKEMVFIDGTNLFYRLEGERLKVPQLNILLHPAVQPRQLVRAYLYTVQQHLDKAKESHGKRFCQGIRIVLGDGVEKKDGNIKEKGVDALLVADLIYHAASRNCEYALVVTADTDFVYALKRVEDFGCRTGVLSICCKAPSRLMDACDDYYELDAGHLIGHGMATKVP